MRWVIGFVLFFCLIGAVQAEVPQQLHYNGYITNAVGDPVHCPDPIQCETPLEMSLRFYDSEEGGTPIWIQLESFVPIYEGTFHVLLGKEASPLTSSLFDSPLWLAIKLEGQVEMSPRQPIVSAAYALRAGSVEHADNAAQLGGLNPEDFASTESVTELQTIIDGSDDDTLAALDCAVDQVAKWDGSQWLCGDDVDTDQVLTEADVDAMVENNGFALASEGINALLCAEGEIAKWGESGWACMEDVDTNTQLSEDQVDGFVANNGYAAQSELEAAQNALAELQALVTELQTSTGADISGIQGQITALETSISAAQSELATESEARQAADEAEATARAAKDQELENGLAVEATTRLAKDQELETGLAAEATARAAKDDVLGNDIMHVWYNRNVLPDVSGAVPCSLDAKGSMYIDVDTQALHICDGTDFQQIRWCNDACPLTEMVTCGTTVVTECGSDCGGVTGTKLDLSQCLDSDTVQCGDDVLDPCGNSCGYTGTGPNVDMCPLQADTACNEIMLDGCGNFCGDDGLGGPSRGTYCEQGTCVGGACIIPRTCLEIHEGNPGSESGVYKIDPDGPGGIDPFNVRCDMNIESPGWTVVARGIGGSGNGWNVSGVFNVAGSTHENATFKFADSVINAIPGSVFRFKGTNSIQSNWYFNKVCNYQHTDPATASCLCSHTDENLDDGAKCGSYHTNHFGLANWGNGSGDCLHTSLLPSSGFWKIRQGGDCNSGNCNGSAGGCDVELSIR